MTKDDEKSSIIVTEENWKDVFWQLTDVSPYLETYLKSYLQKYQARLGANWVERISQFFGFVHDEKQVEAIDYYEGNLSQFPPNAWLIFFVAKAHCYQKANYFYARHLYRQAEKELPEYPQIHMDLGLIFMLLNNWEQALAYYHQTFAFAKNDPLNKADLQAKALFNQAIIYANYFHDIPKSADLLRKALEIRPDYDVAKRALKNMKQSII